MNLKEFALMELQSLEEKCSSDEEALKTQKVITQDIMQIIQTFSEQGHTGFTANYVINLLESLLKFKPLTPLTGAEDEWIELKPEESINYKYQNKRCPQIFKDMEDKCFDMEAKVFSDDRGQTWFTCSDSKTEITFPYMPKDPERIILK